MPALPSFILKLVREQFLALIDLVQPAGIDTHPLGCHRPRIDDAIVFDHLVEVLVYGAGYERIADHACSATTMRRRRDEWACAGLMDQLRIAALTWGHLPLAGDYDRTIGLELGDVAIDGCITKAPCGGQMAGRSPVDRGKGGLKRSQLCDARGIPIAAIPAPANRRDHQLLAATLDALKDVSSLPQRVTVHLDAGYDISPAAPNWRSGAWRGRSRSKALPSRWASAGSSKRPTPR